MVWKPFFVQQRVPAEPGLLSHQASLVEHGGTPGSPVSPLSMKEGRMSSVDWAIGSSLRVGGGERGSSLYGTVVAR